MSTASEHLLEVVAELLVETGYDGVSVRRVATRAGVSIGAVQHHFPTKDSMLAAAMELAAGQFQRRLGERIPADSTAEAALRAVVDELLGIGPERRSASVLWTLRLARAAVDDSTAQTHAREWQDIEDLLAGLLQGSCPERGEEWSRSESATLLALLDGLATAVLVEPVRMPGDRARRILADHLDRVLGPCGPGKAE